VTPGVWILLGPWGGRWWPFEGSRPTVVEAPAVPMAPAPGGWTTVAKAARPAVVNVSSAKAVRGPAGPTAPFFSDPFFRFFPDLDPAPRREQSLGSGVIVPRDGYALTNNHVIEGAQEIRVTLDDRREFRAKLVGADPKTDLAVLKLPGSGFEVLPLADSGRVEVAEVVLAIGNPFGLAQTVTMGIVSAVGRANVGITSAPRDPGGVEAQAANPLTHSMTDTALWTRGTGRRSPFAATARLRPLPGRGPRSRRSGPGGRAARRGP
jgi:S1-C subfamily serine protease